MQQSTRHNCCRQTATLCLKEQILKTQSTANAGPAVALRAVGKIEEFFLIPYREHIENLLLNEE